jgi:hypothetical protein
MLQSRGCRFVTKALGSGRLPPLCRMDDNDLMMDPARLSRFKSL